MSNWLTTIPPRNTLVEVTDPITDRILRVKAKHGDVPYWTNFDESIAYLHDTFIEWREIVNDEITQQYNKRDIVRLELDNSYYSRHLSAMSREGLHEKNDIAGELAYRDAIIDYYNDQLMQLVCTHSNNTIAQDIINILSHKVFKHDP